MILTEADAKTKWCPFARVSGAGNATDIDWHTNRSSFMDAGAEGFDLCIGSACMAWHQEMRLRFEKDQPASEWIEEPTGRGSCGLAVKP